MTNQGKKAVKNFESTSLNNQDISVCVCFVLPKKKNHFIIEV